MSKIPDLNKLMQDLLDLRAKINLINLDMKTMREYYKHQDTGEDDISESVISSWQYVREIDVVIGELQELIDSEAYMLEEE